jgi:hypothetical protein
MVKKISPESRVLSGSNVTPISKGAEVKTTSGEGLPVSGLPVAVDLTEADYFPVVQKIAAGVEETRRATMKQMKVLIPAGPKGEKGDDGPQGDKGDIGPQGPQGEKGDIGPEGPKGNKGDMGDVGAVGPKGDVGPQGEKGETGDVGPRGPQGEKGDAGPQGESGPKGEKGDPGPEELTLSPGSGQRNLLERQADGYKVDAMRAIIPKFGPEYKTIFLSALVKTFPNGSVLYRMENKVINQLRYKSLAGLPIPVSVDTRLQQYFLDKEGDVITVQAMSTYDVLDKDSISVVTSVFMSAVPDKAFNLKDDTPYPDTGELEKFSVYLYVLIGSTLKQNGIE